MIEEVVKAMPWAFLYIGIGMLSALLVARFYRPWDVLIDSEIGAAFALWPLALLAFLFFTFFWLLAKVFGAIELSSEKIVAAIGAVLTFIGRRIRLLT